MNRAEPFGGYSVRDRAKRYEKSAARPRREWDETSDAVPIGRRRSGAPSTAPPTEPRRSSTANPYRVRDRMTAESARRAAADAKKAGFDRPESIGRPERVGRSGNTGTAGREPSKATAKQSAAGTRERPFDRQGHSRDNAAPDPSRNSDAIFYGDRAEAARRLAAYREARRRQHLQRLRVGGIAALIACFFVLCAGAVVYKTFYVVTEVTVEGTSLYTAEEILTASGVAEGDNLYSFSSRVAEENVTLHCPYVRTLTVNRFAPDTVAFTVSEDTAVFYVELYGETWALSPTLRVLDPISADTAAAQGLIRLRLPAVNSAVAGRVLLFEDERSMRSIREAVTEILSSQLCPRVTAVDLRSPQILKIVCDGRYVLDFGDMQDVGIKLKIASAVLSDELFKSQVRAKIDLSSTGETSVILDDQIDPNA